MEPTESERPQSAHPQLASTGHTLCAATRCEAQRTQNCVADTVATHRHPIVSQVGYPDFATQANKQTCLPPQMPGLRSISKPSFHFSKWSDVKACRAVFGPRGERAIFNGDILPAPAAEHWIVGFPGKVDVMSNTTTDKYGSCQDVALRIRHDAV